METIGPLFTTYNLVDAVGDGCGGAETGTSMLKLPDVAVALFNIPLAVAIALRVVVLLTKIPPPYWVEEAVGVLPSVV